MLPLSVTYSDKISLSFSTPPKKSVDDSYPPFTDVILSISLEADMVILYLQLVTAKLESVAPADTEFAIT
jgi:hypothetical protein